jgi:rubrerythrin
MEIHVAAADAAAGEGRVQGLLAASPSLFALARKPFGSAPAERRREIRCRGCGYGAVVAHPLSRCPMCGGGDWRFVRAQVAAGDGEVGR